MVRELSTSLTVYEINPYIKVKFILAHVFKSFNPCLPDPGVLGPVVRKNISV